MIFLQIWWIVLVAYVTDLHATDNPQADAELDEAFYSLPEVSGYSSYLDGIPGVDFPNHTQIPYGISFACQRRVPGFYANPEAECQVYHQCTPDGRSYAFLCGIGTIFNQKTLTCDHWYNYDCAEAEQDYKYNINVFKAAFSDFNNDLDKSKKRSESVADIS